MLLGLAGYDPETVDIHTVEAILPTLASTGTLTLPSGTRVPLSIAEDIRFIPRTVLPYHVNALTITASGGDGDTILQRTYYSVGGGFVMLQTNDDPLHPEVPRSHPAKPASASTFPRRTPSRRAPSCSPSARRQA